MAWTTKPARFNLKLVRSVQKALVSGEACPGMEAESYHLFVADPAGEYPEIYTIYLVHDDEGTYMATCEVPKVLVFEDSEGNAIAAAHAAIKQALAA